MIFIIWIYRVNTKNVSLRFGPNWFDFLLVYVHTDSIEKSFAPVAEFISQLYAGDVGTAWLRL